MINNAGPRKERNAEMRHFGSKLPHSGSVQLSWGSPFKHYSYFWTAMNKANAIEKWANAIEKLAVYNYPGDCNSSTAQVSRGLQFKYCTIVPGTAI
jgi:deoxyribodipyrimidine photolyase